MAVDSNNSKNHNHRVVVPHGATRNVTCSNDDATHPFVQLNSVRYVAIVHSTSSSSNRSPSTAPVIRLLQQGKPLPPPPSPLPSANCTAVDYTALVGRSCQNAKSCLISAKAEDLRTPPDCNSNEPLAKNRRFQLVVLYSCKEYGLAFEVRYRGIARGRICI